MTRQALYPPRAPFQQGIWNCPHIVSPSSNESGACQIHPVDVASLDHQFSRTALDCKSAKPGSRVESCSL